MSILQQSRPWLAGLAVTALAACGSPESTDQAAKLGEPIDAALARVTTDEWPTTYEAGGVVRAGQVAVIASRVVAPVVDVRVKAGDRVRRGQTLVVLDGRELEAHAARAAAAASGSTLALQAAQADVRAAESAVALARATHDRVRGLHDKKSATAQELDEATAALGGADARLAGARARVAEIEQGIVAARAAEQAASVTSSYAVLTAPFDGLVAARHADPGTLAAPGMALVTVEDTTAYRLEARIDEAHARWATAGGAADVLVGRGADGGEGAWRRTRVSEVASLDPERHSFLVKFELPRDSELRSGQFGRVRLLGAPRNVLTVPASAIVRRGQLTFAFVCDSSGAARLRMVSVGETSGDQVELLAGLAEGDQVVDQPPASLEDGRPVRGVARGGDTR